jgi:uridylate kinase
MKNNKGYTIISLGGSLIAPDGVNVAYLKVFVDLVRKEVKRGGKFILITGGGRLARTYQGVLKELSSSVSSKELDLVGIRATRVHAALLVAVLGKIAYGEILDDPMKKVKATKAVLVSGGWKPGRSTDDVAVRLAQTYGASRVINLTNVDYVYDRNPKEFPDAKKIEKISWQDLRKNIIGNDWKPGANTPFDPVAAKLAQKLKLKVVVTNGNNLENLKKIIEGEDFEGTLIG